MKLKEVGILQSIEPTWITILIPSLEKDFRPSFKQI